MTILYSRNFDLFPSSSSLKTICEREIVDSFEMSNNQINTMMIRRSDHTLFSDSVSFSNVVIGIDFFIIV